jgi:hypothetical protein
MRELLQSFRGLNLFVGICESDSVIPRSLLSRRHRHRRCVCVCVFNDSGHLRLCSPPSMTSDLRSICSSPSMSATSMTCDLRSLLFASLNCLFPNVTGVYSCGLHVDECRLDTAISLPIWLGAFSQLGLSLPSPLGVSLR